MHILTAIRNRWHAPGGYREVLTIALPLILSTGAWTVQQFVDRMFLAWYSPETIAAAMPAGILHFTFMTLFLGIAGYVNTFVSQYHGAGEHKRIGAVVWQGAYIALVGALFFLALSPFSQIIFDLVGHEPAVRIHEVVYFKILCYGVLPFIASAAFSAFFSGRGDTWPVMWVNIAATGVNIIVNYFLVFGNFGAPRMGIAGAAIGTVISGIFSCCMFLMLLLRQEYRHAFGTWSGRFFDWILFKRLLKFGVPSGIQFFIDIFGFSVFLLLIGRLGNVELAATNIAFNINTLAFMPMIGMGIAASVLVGKFLGKHNPERAAFSTYSCLHLTIAYISVIAASYVLIPNVFLWLYTVGSSDIAFDHISEMAIILLRFVAIFAVFDSLTIVLSSALKGAGDTRFLMYMAAVLSFVGLIIPSYLCIVVWNMSLYVGWIILTVYIILIGFAFLYRFKGGAWKKMRVIDDAKDA